MKLSIVGLVFLVFLVLKLTGQIAWSWWWVTVPIWGNYLGIVLLVGTIEYVKAARGDWRKLLR